MTERKRTNARNEAATGIKEDVGDKEQLLDDFILEQKENDEEIKEKKESKSKKDKSVTAAGEANQAQAVKRCGEGGNASKKKKRSLSKKRRPLMNGAIRLMQKLPNGTSSGKKHYSYGKGARSTAEGME